MGRSIDLVFYEDHAVCSVEFKLNNWKKAFEQARDHQLGVDYAYLCLPTKPITADILKMSVISGIGLFAFSENGDWPFKIIQKAAHSSVQWNVARERLLKAMKVKHEQFTKN